MGNVAKRLYILLPLAAALLANTAHAAQQIDGQTAVKKMLNAESSVIYTATETTTVFKGHGFTSEQKVYKAGFKGRRVEYTKPAILRGEIIVDDGKQITRYLPRRKLVEIEPSRMIQHARHSEQILRALKNGSVVVDLIGREKIAGRSAYVVSVKSGSHRPSHFRRLWIDADKWVKLRTEDVASGGRVVSSSRFTKINFVNSLPASTFVYKPQAGVRVEREYAQQPRVSGVREAQQQVRFRILQPSSLPSGYELECVAVKSYKGSKTVTLRYSDGVNSLSLFETRGRMLNKRFLDRLMRGPVRAADTYSWRTRDLYLTLVGNLSDSQFRRIANSVH